MAGLRRRIVALGAVALAAVMIEAVGRAGMLSEPWTVPALPPSGPALPVAGPPESGDPMRLRVGPTRRITRLSEAAAQAPDGAVVEVDPGEYVADVAVWTQQALTIRGVGPGVRLIAGGHDAEGKAIWVIRRGRFLVENIAFIGARVADRNGAGIRLEGGELTVRGCLFHDNETGILTAGGEDIRLSVEHSEFGHSGAGDGQSHGIYVGAIGHFRLSSSYFHHVRVGHLVKSRARVNRIEYNRLTDEAGGQASYELEFPNGGLAEVVGNIVHQGSGTRNSVIVSFGAESYRWPENQLTMSHNTVVNDRLLGGSFVRVAPGARPVVLRNNLWVGLGRLDVGSFADDAGSVRVDLDSLLQSSRGDYRLADAARATFARLPLAPVPAALQPRREYRHPASSVALEAPPRYPGALQSAPALK